MSPEATLQPHSLPSSVSDALEAMVGGGLDDLTLEDIDPSNLTDEPPEVRVCVCVCGGVGIHVPHMLLYHLGLTRC